MVKKTNQPARLGRYTNLARPSRSTTPRRSPKKSGRFAWFRNLSKKKKIAVIAVPILAFLILTPLITYITLANDIRDPERLMNRNNTGIALTDINDKRDIGDEGCQNEKCQNRHRDDGYLLLF
jgi:hypothetical protein